MPMRRLVRGWTRPWAAAVILAAVLVLLPAAAAAQPAPQPPTTAAAADDKCAALPPVAQQACRLLGKANPINLAAGGIAGAAQDAGMRALTSFFVDGAVWFVGQVLKLVTTVTSPDLTAQGFKETYQLNFALAPWVMVIMCFIAVGYAVLHRDSDSIGQMVVSIFPAVLFTLASPAVLQLLVGIVDYLSAVVTQDTGDEIAQFLKGLTNFWNIATPNTPMFPLFLSALLALIGAVGIFLDLAVRTALIYLGAAFLPLAWAAIVYPGARKWVRKLGWALVAIIASKFFVVASFSLAAKLLTNGGGGGSVNQSATQNVQGVFIGGGMMLATAFVPLALYRIVTAFDQAVIQHRGTVAAAARSLPGYATGAALVKQNLSMSRMLSGSRSGAAAAGRPRAGGGAAGAATAPTSTPATAATRAGAGAGTTAASAAGGAATAGTALLVRAGESTVDQVGERLASAQAAAADAATAGTQPTAVSDQMAYGDSGGRQWLRVVDHQDRAIYYVNQADPNSPEYSTPNDTYERPHPRWRAEDQSWYRGTYEQQ
jgi:hypothetical protein